MAATKVPELIVTLVLCLTTSTLFVFARFYSRFYLRVFLVEDWLLTVGWILNIALTAISFLDIRYGVGHHIWTIPTSDITPHLKLIFATETIYTLVLPITKLSICSLYRRVVDIKTVQKNLIRVLEVFLVLNGIGFTCFQLIQCVPISAFWNDPFGPQCLRRQTISPSILYAIAACNTFSDFYIIAIVLQVVCSLTLELKQKLALYSVVCIGVFSMVASILRISILAGHFNPIDSTWIMSDIEIWSSVECNVALICAAAPCIRPFIIQIQKIIFRRPNQTLPSEIVRSMPLALEDEWKFV